MAKRKSIDKKSIPFIIIAVIVALCSVIMNGSDTNQPDIAETTSRFTASSENSLLDAYFIDVGQGDCTLFISGSESMLIDCGEKEYSQHVINSVRNYGITQLDYVVVTHAHSDHMGGMADILDAIPTENIIISEPCENSAATNIYGNFLDAADRSNADIILAEPDYTFSLGEAECRILAPFNVSSTEENDNSVIMHITAGTTSFLMTGDTEKKTEKELIKQYPDLSATILKVAHHGSTSSSGKDFIKQISPETAIISVGENSYGHPKEEVLKTLDNYSVSYLRTDKNGTIHINCSADGYSITSDR